MAMDIDTYINNIKINDVIRLRISYKTKNLFGNYIGKRNKSYYKNIFIINIIDEIITLTLKDIDTLHKTAFSTREQIREMINSADHILVTRPKIVNSKIELETLIDKEIGHE